MTFSRILIAAAVLAGTSCDPVESTGGKAPLPEDARFVYGYVGSWMVMRYPGEVVIGVFDNPDDLLEQGWINDEAMFCCVHTGTGTYQVTSILADGSTHYRGYGVECLPGEQKPCHTQGGGG